MCRFPEYTAIFQVEIGLFEHFWWSFADGYMVKFRTLSPSPETGFWSFIFQLRKIQRHYQPANTARRRTQILFWGQPGSFCAKQKGGSTPVQRSSWQIDSSQNICKPRQLPTTRNWLNRHVTFIMKTILRHCVFAHCRYQIHQQVPILFTNKMWALLRTGSSNQREQLQWLWQTLLAGTKTSWGSSQVFSKIKTACESENVVHISNKKSSAKATAGAMSPFDLQDLAICISLLGCFASDCWESCHGHSFETELQTTFKYISYEP